MHPARIAATKMPVPVADNQFSRKNASSGFLTVARVGLDPGSGLDATTGGASIGPRDTTRWRPGTAKTGAEHLSRVLLTWGVPQRNTKAVSKNQGAQAAMINLRGCCAESTVCPVLTAAS